MLQARGGMKTYSGRTALMKAGISLQSSRSAAPVAKTHTSLDPVHAYTKASTASAQKSSVSLSLASFHDRCC